MPNVIINKFCNLSCSYCFIKGTKHEAKETMSVENFSKVAEFFKNSRETDQVRICGGEPTIHPNFREILEIAYDTFFMVHIFTNGINLDKYINNFDRARTTFLINVNSPKDLGKDVYNKITENISALSKILFRKDSINLGVNIYTNNIEDYDYIFLLMDKYKFNHLRVSLCVPINNKEKELNPLDFFRQKHDIIIAFLAKCYKHNISPQFDCNFPPPCIFTEDDIKYLSSFEILFHNSNLFNNIGCKANSIPMDILPNLLVSRCFGVDLFKAMPLYHFRCTDEIYDYFEKEIGIPSRNIMPDEKCYNCEHYLERRCICGCISYKLKELRKGMGQN